MKPISSAWIVFSLLLLGAGCQKAVTNTSVTNTTSSTNTMVNTAVTETARWDNTADGWAAMGTPPACPQPFVLTSPVDLSQATAILYPGQARPDYKPHGGFRFDNATSAAVPYVSPIAGEVVRGGRYLTNGEIQYTFDIIHPCGMMVRVGHLLELTPKFQALADAFPAATEGDSRTTRIEPRAPVAVGEQIATKVGLTKGGLNVFADMGLFDLRQKNAASKNPAYASVRSPELDQHAVCWFDYLSAADEARVRSLPAGDPKAGTTSDYCS